LLWLITVTVLQTERLLLRQFEPGHGEQLHTLTGDPDVMRFVGDLKPFSPRQTRTMIEDAIAHYEQRGFGEYAIIRKATGELIGYGGFTILPERAYPEIDYIFRGRVGPGLGERACP
jgi:RimJ/RimL family protein N-acetyltransferase